MDIKVKIPNELLVKLGRKKVMELVLRSIQADEEEDKWLEETGKEEKNKASK